MVWAITATELKTTEQRLETLNLLVALLPTSNRDTLWALLTFLSIIVQHSTDFVDEKGIQVKNCCFSKSVSAKTTSGLVLTLALYTTEYMPVDQNIKKKIVLKS